ncbi:Queuosine salvage protein [Balamuthia mandrillaris]
MQQEQEAEGTLEAPQKKATETASVVLESAEFIAGRAEHVSVPAEGVVSAARKLHEVRKKGRFSLQTWSQHALNPKDKAKATVDWIFLVDTLNFSFWSESEERPFAVAYRGNTYTGYWSLCAAVNRALEEGIPFTSAEYMRDVTKEKLRHIFRSETEEELPMLEERVGVLNEAGSVLLRRFQGSFVNCIAEAGGNALLLLDLIVTNFSSYRDEAQYHDRTVKFYKRAQILIADLWACFAGASFGSFSDIEHITMFADYRVPQGLLYFGALKYSNELLEQLTEGHLFHSGDELEVEIRGCSIWAVELIRREMARLEKEEEGQDTKEWKSHPLNAIVIDFYLWDSAKENASLMKHLPIHRVRSIYY